MIVAVQDASLEILEKADVPPAQARDTLATKHDLLLLRGELQKEMGELRTEIHASASSTQRQMYGALLGQMAVLLGIAYFFVTHAPR